MQNTRKTRTTKITACLVAFLLVFVTINLAGQEQKTKRPGPVPKLPPAKEVPANPPNTSGRRPPQTGVAKLLVVRGRGVKRPVEPKPSNSLSPPPSLTSAQKAAILQTVNVSVSPGNTFVLSPARPTLPSFGYIIISHSQTVDPHVTPWNHGSNATFSEDCSQVYGPNYPSQSRVELVINSVQAGSKYLIDFAVSSPYTYTLTVYPGGTHQTVSGTKHVLMLYEAAESGEVGIVLKCDHAYWSFYSCEVTPVS